jgi:hypothetical protein
MTDVDGVAARQRLHRLLVDAHDDGVIGRKSVEAADPLNFRAEFRIRRMKPVPDPMRAPAAGFEDTSDCGAAHPVAAALVQGICDRLVRPHVSKGRAVVRGSLARQRHDLTPGLQRHARGPAAPARIEERLDARTSLPARSPLAHEAVAAANDRGDPRRPVPVRKPHDDPRTDHNVVVSVPPPRERLNARPFAPRDAHSSRSRAGLHAPSIHEGRLSFP